MRLSILVTIITLSCLTGSGFTFQEQGDCPSIEAKVSTKNPDPGQENGEITIEAKGGKGQLYYFFFNENGRPLNSTKEKLNFIKGLKAGSYKCSISDEVGCIKLLK